MHLLPFTLVTLGLVVTGCASAPSASRTGTELGMPYALRDSAPKNPATPADDAARVFDIPLLGLSSLPRGYREVRIDFGYGPPFGSAVMPVLRLVEHGQAARGQVIYGWRERQGRPAPYRATRCTRWADSTRTCAFLLPLTAGEADEVAARLETLGVWTISTPCMSTMAGVYTDHSNLVIHRLDGPRFETYSCNAPARRRASDEARAAVALYDYVSSLVRRLGVPPPA